jgi:hypothetical protein
LRGYKIGELNPRPDFIPAVGEPLAPDLEVTATKLAAEFRKIVGHDDSGNKSLSAVPTSIPSRFKEHAPLLRSYFLWQKHYQAIFPMRQDDQEFITENNLEAPWKRKGRPLIELVESVLSSVGTPEDSDEWVNEVARMAGLEIEHLKQMTIGNIGGYFFHKPGLGKKDAKQLDEVNDLWTGITRDHLVEVAHQSRKKGRAGIVILAVGAVKAPIIKACIEHDPCLVQHLIISNDLAAELAKL